MRKTEIEGQREVQVLCSQPKPPHARHQRGPPYGPMGAQSPTCVEDHVSRAKGSRTT
eukprot:m.353672 g.353672  ORF g.353672 m.353672 type:complete len:57 (+) comp16817_c0_seq1:239-409(+)